MIPATDDKVDDGPPAGRTHRRQHRLYAEEDPLHVDGHHPVQLAGAGLFDETPGVDSGVVDEHRRRSERPGHPRDGLCPLGLGGDVERQEARPAAVRVERRAERGAFLGAYIGERHRGAFDCEPGARRRLRSRRRRPVTRATFPSSLMVGSPRRRRGARETASIRIDDEQDLIVFDELGVARADSGDAPPRLCVDGRVELHDLHEAQRRIHLDLAADLDVRGVIR